MQKRARTILRSLYKSKLKLFLLLTGSLVLVSLVISLNKPPLIVLNPSKIAEEANVQCQSDPSGRCFQNFFSSFAMAHDFNETKSVLDELTKINEASKYCHNIAHAISTAEVEKDPENWRKVFSYVPDSQCSYGFFHGIIEGKYRSDSDLIVGQELIESVCIGQLAGLNSVRPQRSCTHAFGHVILVQKEGDVQAALGVCKRLPSEIRSSCYQGIFMEHIQKDNLSEHGIETRVGWNKEYLEEMKAYCAGFTGAEQAECFRSLGPLIVAVVNSNYREGIDGCDGDILYQSKRACNREVLGKILIDTFSQGRLPEKDFCNSFITSVQEYENCLKDIIGFVILTSEGFKSQMQNYCLLVEKEKREFCEQQVEDALIGIKV